MRSLNPQRDHRDLTWLEGTVRQPVGLVELRFIKPSHGEGVAVKHHAPFAKAVNHWIG